MSDLAFRFDLGRLSLNFVATVGARPSGRQVERLATPVALHDWFIASGLVDAAQALPAPGQDDLVAAIELREILYRLIHEIHHDAKRTRRTSTSSTRCCARPNRPFRNYVQPLSQEAGPASR